MRVWALASCSGLLALAACSAEQSSSPNPNAAPLGGEDAADIQAQPGLTATTSSPMARPEVRPRQAIQGGYGLRSAAGKPAATPASSKALPQAAELRQRLERLRSQQGSRLAPSTPLVAAPQPATLPRPTLAQSRPASPVAEPEIPAFNPVQGSNFSSRGVTPLPTLFRPTPSDPESDIPTASTAADLSEVTTASVARTYPLVPLRHQGYSARSQRPAPVLAVRAVESSSTARLHGGTLTAQQPESLAPGETSTSQVAIVEGNTSPQPNSSEASTAATDAPAPTIAVTAASSAPALGAGGHQSSGPVALTPVRQPVVGVEAGGEGHQSQAVSPPVASEPVNQAPVLWESARAETAIVPPESLPLNPPSPQPNFARPQPAESVADPEGSGDNLSEASAIPERILVSSRFPNAARVAAPASQPLLPNPESRPAAALGEAPATPELHHQSQISPAAVRLIPTASHPPKGLPIAYCLSPSGQPVPTTLEAQGSSASLPQFSPSNQADPSLDLAAASGKENPIAPCVGVPSSPSEPAVAPPALDDLSQP